MKYVFYTKDFGEWLCGEYVGENAFSYFVDDSFVTQSPRSKKSPQVVPKAETVIMEMTDEEVTSHKKRRVDAMTKTVEDFLTRQGETWLRWQGCMK